MIYIMITILRNIKSASYDAFSNINTSSPDILPCCSENSTRKISSSGAVNFKCKKANEKSFDTYTTSNTEYCSINKLSDQGNMMRAASDFDLDEHKRKNFLVSTNFLSSGSSYNDPHNITFLQKNIADSPTFNQARVTKDNTFMQKNEENIIKDVRLYALTDCCLNSQRVEDLLIYEYENTAFFIEQYPPKNVCLGKLYMLSKNAYFMERMIYHFHLKNRYLRKSCLDKKKIEKIIMLIFSLQFRNFLEFVCFSSALSFITGYFDDISLGPRFKIGGNIFQKYEKFKSYFLVGELANNLKQFQAEFFDRTPNFTFEDFLNYLFDDCLELQIEGSPMLNAFVFNFRRIYLLCYSHISRM